MKIERPKKTPDWVSVSTGNKQIDTSFKIAVSLIDDLREKYYQKTGTKGWLPVSGGIRGPQIDSSDLRDSAHMVKMSAYLWGEENDLPEILEKSLFIESIDKKTGKIIHSCALGDFYAAHVGMYSRCAADFHNYFLPTEKSIEVIDRSIKMIKWITRTYDEESSGLLDTRTPSNKYKTFWGMHLGEPVHQVDNLDPKSKAVIPTMAFTVLLNSLYNLAKKLNHTKVSFIKEYLNRYFNSIENGAWSEEGDYYHVQFDRISDRWFFSFNGLSEESRELDIIPYYCTEMDVPKEHLKAVARYVNDVILKHRIFPMPIFYPTYAWYSSLSPNGIDQGENTGQIGGAWDTPYLHSISLLNKAGFCESVELGIRKRAESIYRDEDCLEWYFLDGTIDLARTMCRDKYLVSATAHISAVIEGLFGVRPLSPNFKEISFSPCIPFYRRHRHTVHPSPWSEKDITLKITLPYGKRLEFTLRYSESDEKLRIRTNSLEATGYFRIPIDLSSRVKRVTWGGKDIDYKTEKLMDREFISVKHKLDGKQLVMHMNPHPQKGKGTTPIPPEMV